MHCSGTSPASGRLLAQRVEQALPVGLLPSSWPIQSASLLSIRASDGLLQPIADSRALAHWAGKILELDEWDEAHVRILTVLMYRDQATRQAFAKWLAQQKDGAREVTLDGPLLAYLESVHASTGQLEDSLGGIIKPMIASMVCRLVDANTARTAAVTLKTLAAVDPDSVVSIIEQLAIVIEAALPTALDQVVVDSFTLLALSVPSLHTAIVNPFVNRCLEWLVRRFAEDAVELDRVAQALPALNVLNVFLR